MIDIEQAQEQESFTSTTTLVKWDQLKRDLEVARSVDELKDIRDRAEALRQYAKKHKDSLEMQNHMAEITIRCSRRMGEMLEQMPMHPPGPDKQDPSHRVRDLPPKLEDIGITYNDSSRCKAIASIPEEVFEQHIETVKARNEELTKASCLKQARKYTVEKQRSEYQERFDSFKSIPEDYPAYHCSVASLHEHVPANSVDCIITDPPYPRSFLPVYNDLADFAIHALKPGGSLIAMVGQSYVESRYVVPPYLLKVSQSCTGPDLLRLNNTV